jgi:Mg2+ and Co2+ transporter CorA
MPVFNKKNKTSDKGEIDFLLTKDHIITVHYQPLEFLNEFNTQLQKNIEFKTLATAEGPGKFMYYLVQKINEHCLRQLVHIEKNVNAINKNLFSNQEHLLLQQISYTKRDVLNYFLITKPQLAMLQSLKETCTVFCGEPMKIYLADLIADYLRVSHRIENFRDTIESLEKTNAQLLDSKTNAVVQRFSILAFITFPLALFAAIYNVPEVKLYLDGLFGSFWYSFGIMIALTIGTLVVFTNKNWF